MLLLGALIIFALGTFYIEGWEFYIKGGYLLSARFEGAQDLDPGDKVRLSGVTVGKVSQLVVDTHTAEDRPVQAVLWIREGVKIRADDVAEIRASSVFGGSYLAIVRGDRSARVLRPNEEIVITSVGPSITDLISDSRSVLLKLDSAAGNFDTITAKISSGEGALGKLLTSDEFYDEMKAAMEEARKAFNNLQDVAQQAKEGKGILPKLLGDEKMAADVEAITADLRTLTADLKAGKGTFGKLLAEDSLHNELLDTLGEVKALAKDSREGEGALAKLISDKDFARKLETAVSDASVVMADLKRFTKDLDKSTIGKLALSDEAYQSLVSTLDALKESATALAEGKGTLGKLIQDASLYEKASEILENLQLAIEDYREQTPLSTFAGVIFGAF